MRDSSGTDKPVATAAAATGARVVRSLGLNTLRGRFLAIAVVMLGSLVVLAVAVNARVRSLSGENTANIAERRAISALATHLADDLWETQATLQRYLLAPTTADQERLDYLLGDVAQDSDALANRPTPAPGTIPDRIRNTSRDLRRLHELINHLADLRTDNRRLFPATPILIEQMEPRSNEFISLANLALTEAEEQLDQPGQRDVYRLFVDIRYAWTRQVEVFRMYVANRLGAFNSSPEAGMRTQREALEDYAERVDRNLATLAKMERQGKLEFQQSESLEKMQRLSREWQGHWQQANAIYSSARWRTDTTLLRDGIHPLLDRIWAALREIDKELDVHSADDMALLARVATGVSDSLWLLVLAGLVLSAVVLLIFETQIRRPIARVVAALKAEAAGQKDIPMPQTGLLETQALGQAFDHMRHEVHSRQERLKAILDYSVEAIITINEHGLIESFNPAAEELFGYTAAEAVGQNVSLLMPETAARAHDEHIRRYRQTDQPRVLGREREETARHKDGHEFPIALKVNEMWVEGQRMFTGMISDISERKAMIEQMEQMLAQLNTREQRLHTILNNTAEGIITFDEWGVIEGLNQSAERLFGWTEMDIAGKSMAELIAPDARETRDGYLGHFLRAEIQRLIGHEGEVTGRHRDGSSFPMAIKISAMRLENQQKYIAMVSNISERKALLEHLRKLAEHDGLTGLYNRTYFLGELERVVERVHRSEAGNCALLYLDLDHFKYVNDTLGHAAGDKLLIEIANILNRRARKSDLVARLGGDEFTVLVYDTQPELVERVADSFRRHLADYAFTFAGQTVTIGCSVGVAVLDPALKSPAEVMSRADLACHLAKRGGRNQVHVFTQNDAKNVTTMSLDMGWSRRIRNAIEHDRFTLAGQAIVSARNRQISTYEVLVRMLDDDGDIIMPSGFLPTAERFGLSLDIDRWVIVQAIEALAAQRAVSPDLNYTINLSAMSLNSPGICDLIQDRLRATGIDPSALVFEITETVAIADMSSAAALLNRLRELGCRTALDDFGSGMSSFAYLRDLPVDLVKIDGRFVKHIASNDVDRAMVKAMNDIAHALGKETIAEFVESEAAFQVLAELGVDYAQGYHLGRPEALETITAVDHPVSLPNSCRI